MLTEYVDKLSDQEEGHLLRTMLNELVAAAGGGSTGPPGLPSGALDNGEDNTTAGGGARRGVRSYIQIRTTQMALPIKKV